MAEQKLEAVSSNVTIALFPIAVHLASSCLKPSDTSYVHKIKREILQ